MDLFSIVLALPNIDISDLVYWGWAMLQFAVRYAGILSALVFLLVVFAGAGDIIAEAFKRKGKGGKKPHRETTSRVTE